MFNHIKQFEVDFNMNSWIFSQSNQLTSPNLFFQKSIIDKEYIPFKK